MKSIGGILVVLAVVVCPAAALGNMPDPCEYPTQGNIESIEQVGPNVHLDIHAASAGCSFSDLTLWRINENASRRLEHADIVSQKPDPSGRCRFSDDDSDDDSDDCSNDCDDCDGDGQRECPSGRCSDYHIEWVDYCPPPGYNKYDLSSHGLIDYPMDGEATYGSECLSTKEIEVAESEGCTVLGSDDPKKDPCFKKADDDDDNDDNDDSGCGGCTAGGGPAFPLAAIMFGVGLVALVVTRRKRAS